MNMKFTKSKSAATMTEYALLISVSLFVCFGGFLYMTHQVDASLHQSSGVISGDEICTPTSPPGQRCNDGTIFAGVDSATNYLVYVTRTDSAIANLTSAVDTCSALVDAGHTDWRLPLQSELQLAYDNRDAIGFFSAAPYWTGTEVSSTTVVAIDFMDGLVGQVAKTNSYRSRCVRVVVQ